jgi:hypothetical protein
LPSSFLPPSILFLFFSFLSFLRCCCFVVFEKGVVVVVVVWVKIRIFVFVFKEEEFIVISRMNEPDKADLFVLKEGQKKYEQDLSFSLFRSFFVKLDDLIVMNSG